MLNAISPIDGRYESKTKNLSAYFSEAALIKYRIIVEIKYLLTLNKLDLKNFPKFESKIREKLIGIISNFDLKSAERIKEIESETNHDVKAVEYFIKEQIDQLGLDINKEYVHFGLTSQDINNTATPLMIKDALDHVYYPILEQLIIQMDSFSSEWKDVAMLAKTHGQAASPTSLGKEIAVFSSRLKSQLSLLKELPIKAKFGGATGNFNAHLVAFPGINWKAFGDDFVAKLGLERMHPTTQIAHYDHLAAIFDTMSRINTILIDLCRDMWTYIMLEYFKQKTIQGEIGSSAMPHKVNPIDFENAEGNLGIANSIFGHLSSKLPISRLQRDLTDSTVLRNVGVPIAHTTIALQSILKGCTKLLLNEEKLQKDLDENWAVVAEAIQTILRREAYPNPYETLKELTRGKSAITENDIKDFIHSLDISDSLKKELGRITPHNYVGYR